LDLLVIAASPGGNSTYPTKGEQLKQVPLCFSLSATKDFPKGIFSPQALQRNFSFLVRKIF